MNIKPLGKRVLLKPVPVEEQTSKGGVIIPAALKESVYKADVMEVGDEVTKVEVGNLVLITQHVGDRVNREGSEEYYILNEDDLLATIDRG